VKNNKYDLMLVYMQIPDMGMQAAVEISKFKASD
jgi:hypothetical protein